MDGLLKTADINWISPADDGIELGTQVKKAEPFLLPFYKSWTLKQIGRKWVGLQQNSISGPALCNRRFSIPFLLEFCIYQCMHLVKGHICFIYGIVYVYACEESYIQLLLVGFWEMGSHPSLWLIVKHVCMRGTSTVSTFCCQHKCCNTQNQRTIKNTSPGLIAQ